MPFVLRLDAANALFANNTIEQTVNIKCQGVPGKVFYRARLRRINADGTVLVAVPFRHVHNCVILPADFAPFQASMPTCLHFTVQFDTDIDINVVFPLL